MLVTLTDNASVAMNYNGTIKVTMTYKSLDNYLCSSCLESFSGDYIEISVKDHGCGIRPSEIDKLFLPFYTTRQMNGGSGMGLSELHGMLHDQDGHIVVDSVVNEYSQFSIYLPCGTPNQAADSGAAQDDTYKSVNHNKPNILIIDDELAFGNFILEVLKNYDYQANLATNSKIALKEIKKHPHLYDIVITDKSMPELSGIELATEISHLRKDLPIILMSGEEDINQDIDNVKSVLIKPFEINSLINEIRRFTGSKAND
jgi:CheY-like chemotaxis protein